MLMDYAPGHPDIGTAIHGGTAATGSNVTVGILVLVVLVVVGAVLLAYVRNR